MIRPFAMQAGHSQGVRRSRMTIRYPRQAISTSPSTSPQTKLEQANGSAEDDKVEVNEFKEAFKANTHVEALATTSSSAEEELLGMIVGSDTNEQTARQYTLAILARFAKLRRVIQENSWDPNPSNKARFAVKAGIKMMESKCYRDFNDVGPVPGVQAGDWYTHTYELQLIGLHRHLRGNICHLSSTSKVSRTKYDGQSVVCSIIIGENDKVSPDFDKILFLGQGGKLKESRAETGNLALMNSCNIGLPVRVIRREKDSGSDSNQRFTYYGVYKVDRYFKDSNSKGHLIYKFFLQREENQPSLETPKPDHSALPGVLLTADISNGLEQTPVQVVNAVDVNAPDTFDYITAVVYPSAQVPIQTQSCECIYTCEDGDCSCIKRNSSGMSPYNDDGHLVRVRNIIYECGPFCKCSVAACRNRVSQKGLSWRLEVFRTMSKGWGVRTLDFIPSGSFVCELTGEMLTTTQAAERENDEYLFNLDFRTNARFRGKPSSKSSKGKVPAGSIENSKAVRHVVDCRLKGNVARFINHSCSPNLFVQGVLHDHADLNRAHITLFAGEDIQPQSELSYDYAYELDSVRDVHGNVIAKECNCGVKFCRGRMY